MTWITDKEFEEYHQRKAAARRNFIWRLIRQKGLNASAIAKGTGISRSVVHRFLSGGDPGTRTYDKIRLFCERYQRPTKP